MGQDLLNEYKSAHGAYYRVQPIRKRKARKHLAIVAVVLTVSHNISERRVEIFVDILLDKIATFSLSAITKLPLE